MFFAAVTRGLGTERVADACLSKDPPETGRVKLTHMHHANIGPRSRRQSRPEAVGHPHPGF